MSSSGGVLAAAAAVAVVTNRQASASGSSSRRFTSEKSKPLHKSQVQLACSLEQSFLNLDRSLFGNTKSVRSVPLVVEHSRWPAKCSLFTSVLAASIHELHFIPNVQRPILVCDLVCELLLASEKVTSHKSYK